MSAFATRQPQRIANPADMIRHIPDLLGKQGDEDLILKPFLVKAG